MLDTDAVVVGGGATGAGVARDLAMRGLDVVLCERGGLNSGTTGRSHGLLHSGARYAESDPEGARECVRENRVLREIAGECVRETGGYFLRLTDDDPAYFESKLDACRDCGIDATTPAIESIRAEVDGLAADVERVMAVPDAVVYPSRLVAATAASARERGARILADAPVTDLAIEDGRVRGVTVARGDGPSGGGTEEIRTDHVVNAAGAWAGEVAAAAGVDVEMRPARGVMVAVERRVGPVLNRCRPPADGDIVLPHDREAVLGTTSVHVDDPDDYPTDRREVERTIEECARMLPALADAPRIRTWWGVRPLYGPDEDERPGGRGISRGFFLLDHRARDDIEGLTTIVGGKLTTHRLMAEATADRVCARLGVDADCRTDEVPLPGADDPDRLDELVEEFGTAAPADADVVGTGVDGANGG